MSVTNMPSHFRHMHQKVNSQLINTIIIFFSSTILYKFKQIFEKMCFGVGQNVRIKKSFFIFFNEKLK